MAVTSQRTGRPLSLGTLARNGDTKLRVATCCD
jgi:hypothetical protein